MTRPRRTVNKGANRNVAMRNNQRAARPMPFQQQNFQGGLGQSPPVAPGVRPPGPPRPGVQQGAGQCPAGQKPGRTPDGRMGCVPDRQGGAPGASPARRPGGVGAGIPRPGINPPNKPGI